MPLQRWDILDFTECIASNNLQGLRAWIINCLNQNKNVLDISYRYNSVTSLPIDTFLLRGDKKSISCTSILTYPTDLGQIATILETIVQYRPTILAQCNWRDHMVSGATQHLFIELCLELAANDWSNSDLRRILWAIFQSGANLIDLIPPDRTIISPMHQYFRAQLSQVQQQFQSSRVSISPPMHVISSSSSAPVIYYGIPITLSSPQQVPMPSARYMPPQAQLWPTAYAPPQPASSSSAPYAPPQTAAQWASRSNVPPIALAPSADVSGGQADDIDPLEWLAGLDPELLDMEEDFSWIDDKPRLAAASSSRGTSETPGVTSRSSASADPADEVDWTWSVLNDFETRGVYPKGPEEYLQWPKEARDFDLLEGWQVGRRRKKFVMDPEDKLIPAPIKKVIRKLVATEITELVAIVRASIHALYSDPGVEPWRRPLCITQIIMAAYTRLRDIYEEFDPLDPALGGRDPAFNNTVNAFLQLLEDADLLHALHHPESSPERKKAIAKARQEGTPLPVTVENHGLKVIAGVKDLLEKLNKKYAEKHSLDQDKIERRYYPPMEPRRPLDDLTDAEAQELDDLRRREFESYELRVGPSGPEIFMPSTGRMQKIQARKMSILDPKATRAKASSSSARVTSSSSSSSAVVPPAPVIYRTASGRARKPRTILELDFGAASKFRETARTRDDSDKESVRSDKSAGSKKPKRKKSRS